MTTKYNLKKFISCFTLIMFLAAVLLPNFDESKYFAATAVSSTTETTKKPKGISFKDSRKQFFEETWEKHNVITIDDGGGGSGSGGGAGDQNASNAGNKGSYNDAGGTFGQAAGVGIGTGQQQNQGGKGSGTSGGSTGSVKADNLRALKAQIEESRAESLKRVLETALNASSVAASIAERESIQSSIQKRLQQESIKARIAQPETQRQYETPVYVEETIRINNNLKTSVETVLPTSGVISNFVEQGIVPTRDVFTRLYDSVEETLSTIVISEFEPGDFVEEVTVTRTVSYTPKETINKPTSEPTEEAKTVESLEVFEHPIVEEETVVNEAYEMKNDEVNSDDNKLVGEIEEGRGSKGGKDAEAYEDLKGDDGKTESAGNADEKGRFKQETKGENSGKKIFEIDRNGNIGIENANFSISNMRGLTTAVITLLFLLGALSFILGTKDKFKKNNYF